jgi:S-adenosylmethionine synthetase
MARYLARQVVARGWAPRCLVQLAYAIGVAEPVSFLVDAEGASAARNAEIARALQAEFDLTPAGIIRQLDLLRPIYYPTAAYGHFGRDDLGVPWEDTANGGARP